MKKRIFLPLALILASFYLNAQRLEPGFDKEEYIRVMQVSAQFGDTAYAASLPPPPDCRLVYRSPVMGLDNRWELWKAGDGQGIISIRGSTLNQASWLANFYAAMVPAKGELQLSKDEVFSYELASSPLAAVHVGWLVATGFLAGDIQGQIDSCYSEGMKEFLIVGHSQGGAIAYLLTAHLLTLQKQQRVPADIRFKTYCSAAPKPGNLYFGYEYEAMTQGGWAYNVVNSLDWVPQLPFSVQTLDDLSPVNPFSNTSALLKKQPLPKRWAMKYAYRQLTRPSRKAMKNYQKYLGNFVSKSVQKNLDGFSSPDYYDSNYYVRTGSTIVLWADEEYEMRYPQDKSKIFINHFHPPYIYLAGKLKLDMP